MSERRPEKSRHDDSPRRCRKPTRETVAVSATVLRAFAEIIPFILATVGYNMAA